MTFEEWASQNDAYFVVGQLAPTARALNNRLREAFEAGARSVTQNVKCSDHPNSIAVAILPRGEFKPRPMCLPCLYNRFYGSFRTWGDN
jgi:hypothetical protein